MQNCIEFQAINSEQNFYKDRLVILMDSPSEQTKGGVEDFQKRYKSLVTNNQIFILDKRDIEQCYPNYLDADYGNWRKSQAEVDEMNGKKKKQLAKRVGEQITKEQFETEMEACYRALSRCWELSFSN